MKLLVDGLIYQLQRRGGISAYFSAVLPRLCELDPDLEITLFNNFSCPVGVHMHHLFKKVAKDFGSKVKVIELKATPETVRRYGTTDPLINGKIKILGPASEDDVKKAIQEEIDQVKC